MFRVPEEPAGDLSSPSGSGENLGLFLLRKDSERRATLHRVLTEYNDSVVRNIQDTLPQVHLTVCVCVCFCVRVYVSVCEKGHFTQSPH